MEKRIVKITSGKLEAEIVVTQEQYSNYMRPWWASQQRAKRNRDAMEEKGYSKESYEEWKEGFANSNAPMPTAESVEELVEKHTELELLEKALASLLPDERDIALTVLTGNVPLAEYARQHDAKRTTMSDKKSNVLHKLREFFRRNGFEIL